MPSWTSRLISKQLIRPPKFLQDNVHYECMMGSIAYGAASDTTKSDCDVYGFCVPPREVLFPHLRGEIPGFGRQQKRFDQFQQHHIKEDDARGGHGRVIDISIYNIVKYFQLCMENNPNMIDSLFVPTDCVLHITAVGQMVRDNRKMFLHKGAWHKFKGYAFSQMHKIRTIDDIDRVEGKRRETIEEFGWDLKFGYHVVRLLFEAEQILMTKDIDLRRDAEHLKAIRRGEWSLEQVREFFTRKEAELETAYVESDLRYSPDEDAIKELLLQCLNHCYNNMNEILPKRDLAEDALREIQDTLDKYNAMRDKVDKGAV